MFAVSAPVKRRRAQASHPPIASYLATWSLAAASLLAALPAQAAERCNIAGVRVYHPADQPVGGPAEVRIRTTCTPAFHTLRLTQPVRLVIDVAEAEVGGLEGTLPVDDGTLTQIEVGRFGNDAQAVARIQVGLEDGVDHEVIRDGQDIVLRPSRAAGVAAVAVAASAHAFMPTLPANAAVGAAPTPDERAGAAAEPGPKPEPSAVPEAPEATPGQPAAAAAAAPDPAPGPAPTAGRLLALRVQQGGAFLRMAGTPRYSTTHLEGPARLVVDFPGTSARKRALRARTRLPWLQQVRFGHIPEGAEPGLRVVFDLVGSPALRVERRAQGLWIGPGAPAAGPSAGASGQAAPPQQGKLTALQVRYAQLGEKTETEVLIGCDANIEARVDVNNGRAWILELAGATLPESLEQAIDTRAQPGVVSMLSAFQAQRSPPSVHVVASLTGEASQTLQKITGGYAWRILDHKPAVAVARPKLTNKASRAFPRTAGFRADAPSQADGLRNHRISLDVKDADVINVLRLISEETGENIIANEEVKGKITLKLRNVPAEQALDTVLRIKNLDRVRYNNILRIASADSIQKERDLEVARKKALIEVEEVEIKMVTVNYANATEIDEQLKPMLSARGSLQVDGRTNTLIVQDIASNVARLAELARRLDKQTPLVNIQARVVEAKSNFARDLGVQWGGATRHSARTGNPTGVYFPADLSASGAADMAAGNQAQGVVTPARYAVNFPAVLDGKGAGLGFVLGSAGGAQLLDLRLSAMESNGNGRVISSPEVSTLDNKTARVSQGIEIPVSTVSAAGTNTRFVPAVLQLEVTPHVTNDGTVLMKINVQKSAPDFTNKGGQGDPTIRKRQAETEVLVRDGETSVIGGILTHETSESRSEVPFLAKIPILGSLFRRQESAETRDELLVFITPRIINREASTVQAGSVFDRLNN